MALREYLISLVALLALTGAAAFFYDAPLEHHADPLHTPAETMAPWFFLWLQGALKLGNSFLMGVCLPIGALGVLLLLPWMGSRKMSAAAMSRYSYLVVGLVAVTMAALSYIGLPRYHVEHGPIARLFQEYIPEEKPSAFHRIGYQNTAIGVYNLGNGEDIPTEQGNFGLLLNELDTELRSLEGLAGFSNVSGTLLVEELQADLRRIVLRLNWSGDRRGII